jgi:hypothetical protein
LLQEAGQPTAQEATEIKRLENMGAENKAVKWLHGEGQIEGN